MRLTYNPSSIWHITIPEVVFTGDFRISMYTTWIGPTIGYDNTEHYIHGAAATVKLNNTTYTQEGVAPPVSERDGLFHYHKVWFERIGNTFTVYRGENKEEVLRTLTVNTGVVKFSKIGRRGTQNDWRGLAWDLRFEDLEDTNSLNNRFYGLHEDVTELSAFDDLNNQNGTYSQERGADRGGLFEATPTGWRNRELGYLRDMSRYNISEAKVLATFSASVLQSTFHSERRTFAEWEFWQQGAELEFYQFGNGGEYIQDAIDDAPSYISGLLAKGYLPENITAVVHIGGNDVSGSIPYSSNKDTNDNIINMRARLEQLYTLLSDAGFTIIWLPITWRNYGTVPPDSNGSEPFNTNIVEPFLRDVVGASSWDSDLQKPKYDFYNFVKDEFALDNGFLQDAVHPSGTGQEGIRVKFAEWFSPLYIDDTTDPVVTNNGPATLTITVGDTYTPDFSTNEGNLVITGMPDTSTAGTYTVTATATDAAGNVGSATQTVIVEEAQQVNQPPVANAGPDQSVAAGVEFILDGTGSQDTDGTIVEWRWTQIAGDPVILDASTPSQPRATSPSRTSAQTLTFQLITVDDEGEESAPGTVNVNVAAVVLSEILKVIERLDFDLVTQGDVNAYFGRANREVMKLKPSDPTGLALDADGFMMLDSNTIEEIKVIAEGGSISSKTDSINLEGSEMLVRLGDLEASKNGNIYFSIVVFVEGDTKGVVVSSKGSSGNKPMSYVTL